MPVIDCPNPACRRKVDVAEAALAEMQLCPYSGQVFRVSVPARSASTAPPAAAPAAIMSLPPETASPPPAPPLAEPTLAVQVLPITPPTPLSPAETLSLEAPTVSALAPVPGIVAEPPPAVMPMPANGSLPSRIGRFEVRQRLSEGAFGVVYQAYDPQLDREVALKVAKSHMLNTEQRVKRFLREAKAAANLRHPNIVPVHDSGRDGAHYYIASAFISGLPGQT